MFMLSVPFNGHNLIVVDHQGEPWAPILPLCKAMQADPDKVGAWTQKMQCFRAQSLQIPVVDRVCEFLCVPLRKLFGWLTHLVEGEKLAGADDALYEAWATARPSPIPADGRVMLTIRQGKVDVAQQVPEDWLVAPLEGFHHISTRAGYRVTADLLHDFLYASRV
jgi:hypothetical protein